MTARGLMTVCLFLAVSACPPVVPPGGSGGGGGGSATGGGFAGVGGGGGSGGGSNLALPTPSWAPTGQRVTWNGISFNVPPGMTGTDKTTYYELSDPGRAGGVDTCSIVINAPQPASGDLAQQASALLKQAYGSQGFQVLDDNYGTDLISQRTIGASQRGTEVVELRAELRRTDPSPERGHLMLISVGAQVVPLVGYSPTTAGCTQLSSDNAGGIIGEVRWRQLAYSLDLTGSAPRPSLVGEWSLFQGASAQEWAFAANGRFAWWGALQSERRVSQTELELTTSSFGGDGSWRTEGDVVALYWDSKPAEAFYFRLYDQHAVSPSMVVSQSRRFGLLKDGAGGVYEVSFNRK